MAIKIYSAQVIGLDAEIIDVEVDLAKGLHSFSLVGLPDKAVEESKERISAAIRNTIKDETASVKKDKYFTSPKEKNQKIIVSLAPADIKKEGPVFDLSIALGYLLSSKQIRFDVAKKLFLGELSLSGNLRPIKGTLFLIQKAKKKGFTEVFLPKENAQEAALIKGIKIFGCHNLEELTKHLYSKTDSESNAKIKPEKPFDFRKMPSLQNETICFSEVKGQETAKRGLEIAAAGGHNLLMVGPPGSGKTMLAKAFAGILPELSFEEALEVTGIHSIVSIFEKNFTKTRPFRSPHHTSSYVAMVGGGSPPKPGEITFAHRGVLFLDEFPEFERRVIESLRQPLEDKNITISRAKRSVNFPTNFILIATANPCPCGNKGSNKECICNQGALWRYQRKLSGPIIDRIDLWLSVPQVELTKLSSDLPSADNSDNIRERVNLAREIQRKRFTKTKIEENKQIFTNSEMTNRELKNFAPLKKDAKNILNQAAEKLDLSGRAYYKIIKLARTIADLEGEEEIEVKQVLEALQYRPKIN